MANPYPALNWSYFAGNAKYATREFQYDSNGKLTHPAIDLIASSGSTQGINVTAPCSGTVVEKKDWDKYRGNYIIIECSDKDPQATNYKLRIRFQHLKSPAAVKDGANVSKGTVIGQIGNSGYVMAGGVEYYFDETSTDKTTGAHLHAEVFNTNGTFIPPSWFYSSTTGITGTTTPCNL